MPVAGALLAVAGIRPGALVLAAVALAGGMVCATRKTSGAEVNSMGT
jgi:hypothetical protein